MIGLTLGLIFICVPLMTGCVGGRILGYQGNAQKDYKEGIEHYSKQEFSEAKVSFRYAKYNADEAERLNPAWSLLDLSFVFLAELPTGWTNTNHAIRRDSRVFLAQVYAKQRNTAEAINELTAAIAIEENQGQYAHNRSDTKLANMYAIRGLCRYERGALTEAKSDYAQAINYNKDEPLARELARRLRL